MTGWIERFSRVSLLTLTWFGRLYGVFFLALGLLFFYWSGRGLLAYATGVRAAWSEPLACLAGLVAGILSLWAGFRMIRSGFPTSGFGRLGGVPEELEATLEDALKLEQTDSVAARQLLDHYFMHEATATEARRADLRQRAPYDLKAAQTLRHELQDEVASNALVRKDMLANLPEGRRASMLTEIDAANQRLQSELLQLDGAIERLKLQ